VVLRWTIGRSADSKKGLIMKVPLEILVVSVLLFLGWNQPFQEHWNRITGVPPPHRVKKAASPTSISPAGQTLAEPKATSPAPSWMHRPTILDRPQ